MKHATEMRVGGRLETNHSLISWMIRHCCWVFCRYHVRADGRTPHEVLRNNSYRGGLACFGEIVLGSGTWIKTAAWQVRSELAGAGLVGKDRKHGRALVRRRAWAVRKFRTIRRQPESAIWRREYVDKLSGDPFNPKPKTSMAVGPGKLPTDLQWGTRASPNVDIGEAPGDEVPEPAGHTKALVRD